MAYFNESIFRWFFLLSHRNVWFDFTAAFLAQYLIFIALIFTATSIASQKNAKQQILLLATTALSAILARGLIAETILFLYNVPRPFEGTSITPLISASGQSFPSGMITLFFAIATSIFYANKKQGGLLFSLGVINAIMLVIVGVHWPFDVIAGASIGILGAILIHSLIKPISILLQAPHEETHPA